MKPKEKGAGPSRGHGAENNHLNFNYGPAVNGGFDDGRPVLVVHPVEFDAEVAEVETFATPQEKLTAAMRLAAVRTYLRIEPRSFSQIAADLGVTRAAISRHYVALLRAIGGMRDFGRALRRMRRKGQP